MTIKQLYPTQRPALDLNFAQQKRLDSRVTFTRGSTATYVGSDGLIKTAAANKARFDHDPDTGESLGLLVEESRTNLLTYSEQFDDASWNKGSNSTVSANTATAPDGNTTADKLIELATSGYHTVSKNISGFVSGTNYTLSCFAKAGERSRVGFGGSGSMDTQLGSAQGVVFDLTGDGSVVVGGSGASIQKFPNGWYKCSYTWSQLNTGNYYVTFGPVITNTTNYTGDGTSGVYVWGTQLEAGSFPTSYIPTSGSTVTRSADVASLTNSNIYNTDSFTILNEPFGSAAGASTLSLVGAGETPIKRTAVYSQDLTQTQINASVGKTDEFWRWRILGSSFGLPQLITDGQVTVDWGDGTVETLTTSDHTFTDGGGYHEIGFRLDSGTYFRPQINDNASHDTKVVAVGPAPESMKFNVERAFQGCSNLKSFDATVDATGGTDFRYAWYNCNSLTSFPLIDTSSGTYFSNTWNNCNSLTSFPLIDTSSGTNFNAAWYNCSSLTSFPLIDTSSGTDFGLAWRGCSGLTSFPLIDTSSGTGFYQTWRQCSGLTSFPLIDTSSATSLNGAWQYCGGLTSFPLINTSSVTDFSYAWQTCSGLTSFPLIDTSSGTDFSNTWYNCSSLTSFPAIDTSSGTNFNYSWIYCSGLTSFPLIDTSSGTTFDSTWFGCTSLTSFPAIDISSGTKFYRAWYNCTSLTSFPANFFDSWTGTPANDCFYLAWDYCGSLTATSVENILNSIDTSGQSAPASGVDITIDYDAGTGTPSISTAVTNLKSRGWTITLNGVAQ